MVHMYGLDHDISSSYQAPQDRGTPKKIEAVRRSSNETTRSMSRFSEASYGGRTPSSSTETRKGAARPRPSPLGGFCAAAAQQAPRRRRRSGRGGSPGSRSFGSHRFIACERFRPQQPHPRRHRWQSHGVWTCPLCGSRTTSPPSPSPTPSPSHRAAHMPGPLMRPPRASVDGRGPILIGAVRRQRRGWRDGWTWSLSSYLGKWVQSYLFLMG